MDTTIDYRGKKFPVNENGNNANIRITILDDELMKKARFTDLDSENWYYSRRMKPMASELTFNFMVKKDDPENWRIDVLDEEFCQPYNYQAMIQREYKGEKFPGVFHWDINKQVEYEMEHLTRLGIISGWEKGDYI